MSQTEPQITAALVRELLKDQHPDLAGLPLREVEGGWGNQMWRLGNELAVRIQRMDTTPEPSSRNDAGYPDSLRTCRYRSPSRFAPVHQASASASSGPS